MLICDSSFAAPAGIKAGAYLRRRRRRLLNAVCQWTNEKKFPVNQLLARLTSRCDELGLHVLNDDPQQDFRVTAFITTLVMNYLFTGKFKRTNNHRHVERSRDIPLRNLKVFPAD